jgi:hypothetical protein
MKVKSKLRLKASVLCLTLPPPPPWEWKETHPFKKNPNVYLVKEPKTIELTPVQKAWAKYKETSDFTDPDDLMLVPITEQDKEEFKEFISVLT